MRFDTRVHNVGTATFTAPDIATNPQLFEYAPCHQHFHYKGFARYRLYTADGKTLLTTAGKLSYCMEDSERYAFGSDVPCSTQFACDRQGKGGEVSCVCCVLCVCVCVCVY